MPDEKIPYDYFSLTLAEAYFDIGIGTDDQ